MFVLPVEGVMLGALRRKAASGASSASVNSYFYVHVNISVCNFSVIFCFA